MLTKFMERGGTDHPDLPQERLAVMDAVFDGEAFELQDLTPAIARRARDVGLAYGIANVGDCVVLATALVTRVEVLLTWDRHDFGRDRGRADHSRLEEGVDYDGLLVTHPFVPTRLIGPARRRRTRHEPTRRGLACGPAAGLLASVPSQISACLERRPCLPGVAGVL